jgi:putative ABC transport system ATP-binding protein
MEMLRVLAHERGRAVVIVTHDPRVMEFADRTICIEDGRIVKETSVAWTPAARMASSHPMALSSGIPA